jgi:hypothetical protein
MGIPIVAVTGDDRARGGLVQDTAMATYKALHEDGVVILRGLFPPEAIAALHAEFSARYGNLDLAKMEALSKQPPPNPVQPVGDGRFEIAVRMTGGFGQPSLFANALLINLLMPILGRTIMRLASATVVISFPGAQFQHVHRDNPQLFEDIPHIGPALQHYAITASIPLIDVDHRTGPTGFWPGTHRSSSHEAPPETMQSVPFQRGDCALVDYRTLHAGMPNSSNMVRPILYLVYQREWFFDDGNHRQRLPLDMPLDAIQALPEDLRPLMLRAHQQAVRVRQYAPA